MESQKLENLLQLSLSLSSEELSDQTDLSAGYSSLNQTWELIVKYHGNLKQYASENILIEELLAGYGIIQLTTQLIDRLTSIEEIEYIEKPKFLSFM